MPRRRNQQRMMRALFMALGVLIVMLIVVLIVIATSGDEEQRKARLLESGKFIEGVTVAGINVGGMTYEEAAADSSINEKAQEFYNSFIYTFTVEGKEYTYSAEQLGLEVGLDKVLEKALSWGNVGDEIAEQKTQAQESGVDFPAAPYADLEKVAGVLKLHKVEYDLLPKNATLKLADTYEPGNNVDFVDGINGIDVNISELARLVTDNIDNGDYSVVEAPVISTEPSITVEELRANTVMITSWYSEFNTRSLSKEDRVNNIKILGGIVNGTVIMPGETWSINEAAGPRNATTAKELGWTKAPGLIEGRHEDQYGGGVCQISSTVYNAAIRAELDILDRTPHSWPSDYIPEGLDATISTGGPDLKIFNPYDYPVLLACHVDEEEKRATVEVYGPPLPHGYTVDFIHQKVKTMAPPQTITNYNVTETPDGTPIAEGKSVEWVDSRTGSVWKVYKQYLDSDGNVVDSEYFSTSTYNAFQGEIYVNGPNPLVATPTPAPT